MPSTLQLNGKFQYLNNPRKVTLQHEKALGNEKFDSWLYIKIEAIIALKALCRIVDQVSSMF